MNESEIFIFQKGFNYSQDGPGNRLVYHLSGCNLCCPWCSNPEGLKRTASATSISVEELLKEAEDSKMIFIDGGGVTFTGGEVSLQKEAVLNAVKELKKRNISTCIETNASLPLCEDLFSEVDYMIADYKSPDKEKLKKFTNAELNVIENNLLYRASTGKPLLVRIPLVNFFNCSCEDFDRFVIFFKSLKEKSNNNNLKFEILTYHEFGKEKYDTIGLKYTVTDGFVSHEKVTAFKNKLESANLNIIST